MVMKTFYWIAVLTILLIGVIGKLIKKESFKLYDKSTFHNFYVLGIILIWVLLASNGIKYWYSYSSAQEDRINNHIPCLDTTMYLQSRENNKEEWWSYVDYNQDSIKHISKTITINDGGILKEQDVFINKKENKELILETTLPSFLRNKKINHKLIKDTTGMGFYHQGIEYELTEKQVDSIILSWNLNKYFDCKKYY